MSYYNKLNVKQPATIDDQIKKLRERGCVIENEKHAKQVLGAVNYYRLAYYFAPFFVEKGHYKKGTSFEKVLKIYDFDRELRNVLLVALEEIEITIRAICSNYHALKYGALGYKNPDSFDRTHNHRQFISKLERIVESNGDSGIVAHHKGKYGGEFPVWAIVELFSFGMLTHFFRDLKVEDKAAIVEENFSDISISAKHLISWLDCLSDLRNHCAHYNRLYDNRFWLRPKATPEMEFDNTLFSYVFIMKQLHMRRTVWNGVIVEKLKKHFFDYSDVLAPSDFGFSEGWEKELSWKIEVS
ncbi:MAG: Abi family protein [Eubacterium sp.]|jgi:abortive infection bacteriophage resistance protein|nr:Abi family protein [Eubacterium sp.]